VEGLRRLVGESTAEKAEFFTFMELALHGLAEYQIVNKEILESAFSFGDLLSGMLDDFSIN
jgi:magnesium chelatase subunit I